MWYWRYTVRSETDDGQSSLVKDRCGTGDGQSDQRLMMDSQVWCRIGVSSTGDGQLKSGDG